MKSLSIKISEMSKWSSKAWENVIPVFEKTVKLDFLKDLMSGELSPERFRFYIEQDSLYLEEYGKVLAGLAFKLQNPSHREAFLNFATDTMSVESALHKQFIINNNNIEQSPACLLYTNYLHTQFSSQPVEVAAAAILPCFVVYKKVGDYILENQTKEQNPYQAWIDTYSSEEFDQAVEMATKICDELAENSSDEIREKMYQAYTYSTKLEWIFWQSAYQLEKWPV